MLDLDNVVIDLKEHEGFRGEVYQDTLGYDTVGYGTKMPLSQREATVILRMRLIDMVKKLDDLQPIFKTLPVTAQEILANMAYQMGVIGLLQFRKTWLYLEDHNFKDASIEMLDSLWATQTPNRAKELSEKMAKLA